MTSKRRLIQLITAAVAAVVALFVLVRSPEVAHGQMVRYGTIDFQNDTERSLFHSLLCPCGGCIRESLGVCLCATAHKLRAEVRGELAAGRTIAQIKEAYGQRHGTNYIAIPPNEGGHRLLYLVPLGAIVVGAGLVIVTLRRWKQRSQQNAAARAAKGEGVAAAAHDEYDEKLDEELRNLDRE